MIGAIAFGRPSSPATDTEKGRSKVMLGRSAQCEAVLKRYGLEQSSMAVIGADRLPESTDWRVMITGGVKPEYVEVEMARKLANELARVGERALAERLSAAVETAKRQMRPRE